MTRDTGFHLRQPIPLPSQIQLYSLALQRQWSKSVKCEAKITNHRARRPEHAFLCLLWGKANVKEHPPMGLGTADSHCQICRTNGWCWRERDYSIILSYWSCHFKVNGQTCEGPKSRGLDLERFLRETERNLESRKVL